MSLIAFICVIILCIVAYFVAGLASVLLLPCVFEINLNKLTFWLILIGGIFSMIFGAFAIVVKFTPGCVLDVIEYYKSLSKNKGDRKC